MKKHLILSATLVLLAVLNVDAQQYKSVADTGQLNKEYVAVQNEIAMLTEKLDAAQGKISRYERNASESASDARESASANSSQAQDAVDGSVKEARKARRKAKKSVKAAKQSRSANANYRHKQEDITSLTERLAEKKTRLAELQTMRTAIMAGIQAPGPQ